MVNIHVNDKKNQIKINVSPTSNSVSSTIGNETFYNGLAKEWAISPELVQGEDYSAKHYAGQAKQSEEIATDAISQIRTSVEDAAGYAQSAQESAEYIVNNAPEASIEQTSTGAIITTKDLTHGTTTATILNGAKGDKGDTGAQGIQGIQGEKGDTGFSPTATVSKSGKVSTLTVTDLNGTTTTEILDGADSGYTLPIASSNTLGGVKIGNNLSIDANGVLSATASGTVDQTYNPSSVNAQSGVAINGAGFLTSSSLNGYATQSWVTSQGYTTNTGTVTSVNNVQPVNGNVNISIPSAVTESTVSGWGFTKNVGTVTSVNNIQPDTNGNVTISTRNVGEVITSTLPLTDAGLHLLDGTLLQYGIYKDFIDYIAELHTSNPNANYFCTETEWQNSVTTYGSCGKFVYDSVSKTVRLPKISDILQSTTDINALGDLIKAGLPNITGTIQRDMKSSSTNVPTTEWNGAMGYITGDSGSYGGSGTTYRAANLYFDASKSNPIYGNSNTVQPQTIKAFVYIVVANSTKTSIQVDIDQVATDLNGKADTDLTNTTDSAKVLMSGMGMPSNKYIDLTLGASGTTYTAPANGWYALSKTSTGAEYIQLSNVTAKFNIEQRVSGSGQGLSGYLPVKKGNNVYIKYTAGGATNFFRFIYAQGSESEAN